MGMVVIDKSENKEAQAEKAATQEELDKEFVKTLQGSETTKKGTVVETEADDKEKTDETEEGSEENSEENAEEKTDDAENGESTEETTTEEAEEKTEEDPKLDGRQKRINELTAAKRRLESELAQLKQDKPSDDPDRARLEKMSAEELRTLKKEVRLAWKKEADEGKSRKLMELEDKIDETIQSVPARFERQQLASYQQSVATTADELGANFTETAQTRIFNKAKAIFDKFPTLQKSVDGMAIAWTQAVDWYKDIAKLSNTKEKNQELQRENNGLKKKVTLDTAVAKGATKGNETERLFKRAKQGDRQSELDYFTKVLDL